MPRIQEYSLESEGAGPVGGLDPRVESAAAVGQGLERLGQSVQQAGQQIHHREAQAEVSALSAEVAQQHVDFNQQLQDEVASGTLNVEEFKKRVDDWGNQAASGISTAEGRDYFNKTAARLKYSVIQGAVHGQTQIASRKAVTEWQTSQNSRVNQLYQDPSAFMRVIADNADDIDARIKTGVPAKMRDPLLKEANSNAAMASIDGWARLGDTGETDAQGNPITGATIARKMLEGKEEKYKGDSELLNQFLSPQQKEQMLARIDHFELAHKAEKSRQERDAAEQAQAASDETAAKFIALAHNNKLTDKMIINSDMDWKTQEHFLNMIEKKETKGDPMRYAELRKQLFLPEGDPNKYIKGPQDVTPFVADGSITTAQANSLTHYWGNTEEGKAYNKNRKNVEDLVNSAVVLKDPTNPAVKLPASVERKNQFWEDAQAAELEQTKLGKSVLDLYKPSSPDYLGRPENLKKYTMTMQQALQEASKKYIQQTIPVEDQRRPGETIDQFNQRRKAKGAR